jgi:hypothetical protein
VNSLEWRNVRPNVTQAALQSLLCRDNYNIKMSGNKRPPENPPEKDEDDKLKFQEYIIPLFMDFAEKTILIQWCAMKLLMN